MSGVSLAVATTAALAALASVAGRRAERLRGSRSGGSTSLTLHIRNERIYGFTRNRVSAFEEISVDFLGDHYYSFFDLEGGDVSTDHEKDQSDHLIEDRWDELGVYDSDRVFVLLEFRIDREQRGRGEGRIAYQRMEDELR